MKEHSFLRTDCQRLATDIISRMAHMTIQAALQLAMQHHRTNRLYEAEHLYRQILAQQPRHPQAIHGLAMLAHQAGETRVACDLLRQAVAILPNFPEAYNSLGMALVEQEQWDEAIAAFQKAIELRPHFAEAHNNLGNVLGDKQQLDQAIAAYRQAVAIEPRYPEAQINLGNALKEKSEIDEAVAAYRNAVAAKPDFAEAHNNLGAALKEKGRLDEAIASYQRAIALQPNLGEVYSNLGNVLRDTGDLDQAIASHRKAIALRPSDAHAHSNLIFTKLFDPACDARSIADEHRRWHQQHAEPLGKNIPPHANQRSADRRLRIGYISPDFRNHVVGRNLLPLFRRHNHEQFEITCYAQVSHADAVTEQFQRHADSWRNITGISDEQVARQVREDKIDILVDLTLHMANHRLLVFARKPAPVQATFGGYPGTTGLATIDYRISDPYLDPPGADTSIYSEQTLHLPDSFWCFDPLDAADIEVSPLPAIETGAVTFGCLNNFCKLNPAILNVWAQVLRQVKNSRLLLLAEEGRHRRRTIDELARLGVEASRIEFVPFQSRLSYLRLYHRIDLGLDSFPYNGHTTSLESLWMGVPVVTLVGNSPVSRAGWSQLSNLEMRELAADTPERFVRIAVELGQDLPRLQHLRGTLRQRMERSPLMDGSRFTANIEAAYRQMWRQYLERH